MRKVIVSEFMALDGVFESPAWTFQYSSPEQEAFKFAELKACDSLLLGRVTYEGFAAAWPQMAEQTGEYGAMMNGYPKYVASRTLETAEWNAGIIKGDVAEQVAQLKQHDGGDMLVFGSGTLVRTLMEHNLVDELRLMLFPVVVGQGRRLFSDGPGATCRLVEAKPFASGVVVLTYAPAAAAAGA